MKGQSQYFFERFLRDSSFAGGNPAGFAVSEYVIRRACRRLA